MVPIAPRCVPLRQEMSPNHPRTSILGQSDCWPPTCLIRQLWGSHEITGDIFILSGDQTRQIRAASMKLLT
eukprot:779132-Prymnesium_polylepis.1